MTGHDTCARLPDCQQAGVAVIAAHNHQPSSSHAGRLVTSRSSAGRRSTGGCKCGGEMASKLASKVGVVGRADKGVRQVREYHSYMYHCQPSWQPSWSKHQFVA